jgi:nonsense-mediated mRNA decay protein 3
MFCVECGKEIDIFRNGVCIDCYIKNKRFTSGPEILDIFICPKCSSYKFKNLWLQESFEEVLHRYIKNKFKIITELENIQITTDCDKKEKTVRCKTTISGQINKHHLSEIHNLTVRIKGVVCDICSKQYGGYFEAIFQIRADKRILTSEEITKIRLDVEQIVTSFQQKGNRGLFITDIGEEHGGIDFYFSEKGSAYSIAKKMQEQLGGEIKTSSTNIGMKDSKQIYRMTYLLRLPAYKTGDFIKYNNTIYYINALSTHKLHVVRLDDWSTNILLSKDVGDITIVGNEKNIQEMIIVSQTETELQIMDPNSYALIDIKKPKKITYAGKVIPVVTFNDVYYIYPKKHNN